MSEVSDEVQADDDAVDKSVIETRVVPDNAVAVIFYPADGEEGQSVQVLMPDGISGPDLLEGNVPEHVAWALTLVQELIR